MDVTLGKEVKGMVKVKHEDSTHSKDKEEQRVVCVNGEEEMGNFQPALL